jgi:hypothetical protein
MTPFGVIWLVIMSGVFAVCGWFCVFRTNMLVTWGRKNYEKSKFVQAYPFSNVVQKSWYPTYIRCAGIFIWLWALAILFLVTVKHFR